MVRWAVMVHKRERLRSSRLAPLVWIMAGRAPSWLRAGRLRHTHVTRHGDAHGDSLHAQAFPVWHHVGDAGARCVYHFAICAEPQPRLSRARRCAASATGRCNCASASGLSYRCGWWCIPWRRCWRKRACYCYRRRGSSYRRRCLRVLRQRRQSQELRPKRGSSLFVGTGTASSGATVAPSRNSRTNGVAGCVQICCGVPCCSMRPPFITTT